MRNRFIYLTLTLLLALTISGTTEAKDLRFFYSNEPMQIDGKLDDWNNLDEIRYHEESSALIGLAHDGNYLYVQVRFRDAMSAFMIRRAGFTLVLNNEGKKEDYFKLRFNGGPSRDFISAEFGSTQEQQQREMMNKQMDKAGPREREISCYREGWVAPRKFALDASQPVAAAYDTSYGFHVYEFRIPIGDTTNAPNGFPLIDGKKIAIGIELIKMPIGGKRPGSMGGGKGGGGGMGGRGGGGKGGRGGGMGDHSGGDRKMKKEIKWLKATLDTPKDNQ